jgi:hypothetical protein
MSTLKFQLGVDFLQKSRLLEEQRTATGAERQQILRIWNDLSKSVRDPNIGNVTLEPEMSVSDIIYLLSSACPEVIEFTLQILSYQGEHEVHLNDDLTLYFSVLDSHPRFLHAVLYRLGWRFQPDVSNKLQKVRFKYHWLRRPRKRERIRGYRDHGNLANVQDVFRRSCLTDYYLEKAKSEIEQRADLQKVLISLAKELYLVDTLLHILPRLRPRMDDLI